MDASRIAERRRQIMRILPKGKKSHNTIKATTIISFISISFAAHLSHWLVDMFAFPKAFFCRREHIALAGNPDVESG